MTNRQLYICTQCHEFWSSAKEAHTCPSCGAPVCPVEQDYAAYAAWSPEEKAAFKADYIACHDFSGYQAAPSARPAHGAGAEQEMLDQPFDWIGMLDKMTNISLLLILLCAVILFFVMAANGGVSVLLGLLASAGLVVAGLASAAMMKIFIGMAKDLKAVRQKLEA